MGWYRTISCMGLTAHMSDDSALLTANLFESTIRPISQSCGVAKSEFCGGLLGNQACQTEWKTAPLDKVQLCEYETQTLEAFHSYAKFDCPVAHQIISLLATVHNCPI